MSLNFKKKANLELVQSVGQVEVEKSSGKKLGPKKIIEVPVSEKVMETPFANIGVSMSHTVNLGNYESCRIQVSLHLPAQNVTSEINDAFDKAKVWVDKKLGEVIEEIHASKGE